MKKILSIMLVGISAAAFSQVSLAAKGNLLYNTDSPKWSSFQGTTQTAIDNKGENNVGYNVGLSAKIDLPITSLFVMPELYYTTFKNSTTVTTGDTSTTLEAKTNRVDLPVLLGYNVLGNTLGVFVGPVASYNLAQENQWEDFKENAAEEFTVGYQFGAQAMLSNFIISARYEGALSDDQREFINNQTNETIRYDGRPSLLMFGLGYKF